MTDMMKLFRSIFLFLCVMTLTSCSLFSPVKTDTINKFLLSKIPTHTLVKKPRNTIILVSIPDSRPVFNTTQMAYTLRPYQISYFSQNQWAEVPAEMFQPLLVQTLQNTRYFRAVVTPPYSGSYNYSLGTQILELTQDFSHRTPMLLMTVRAQIMRISTNQIVGTRQFSVSLPIPQGTPYGGVYAANQATAIILEKISRFCLEKAR